MSQVSRIDLRRCSQNVLVFVFVFVFVFGSDSPRELADQESPSVIYTSTLSPGPKSTFFKRSWIFGKVPSLYIRAQLNFFDLSMIGTVCDLSVML